MITPSRQVYLSSKKETVDLVDKPADYKYTSAMAAELNTTVSNYTNSSLSNHSGNLDAQDVNSIVVMFFLAVQGCIVVLINALVIFLIARNRSLQTVTNLCLGSLAISDMLTGLFVIPLIISCNAPGTAYNFGTCLSMELGNRFLAISTILHLLVITCERYHTIVFSRAALTHSSITIAESFVGLPVLWAFALMASLVQLFWIFDPDEETKRRATIAYDLIVLSVLVLLPLVIMLVAYTHIFYVLRKQVAKIKRDLRHISERILERHRWKEKRVLLIYGAMILVYLTAWFNYFFMALQDDLNNTEEQPSSMPFWANIILLFLKNSTGILNPILYTFLKQDFRNARKKLHLCAPKEVRRLSRNAPTESATDFPATVVVYRKGFSQVSYCGFQEQLHHEHESQT